MKEAYSALFSITPEANTLSKEDLFNEFVAVYKLSPRLASSATPAFLWLCSEAGMKIAAKQIQRERMSYKTKLKKERQNEQTSESKIKEFTGSEFYSYPLKNGLVIVSVKKELAVNLTLNGKLKEGLNALLKELENSQVDDIKNVVSEEEKKI